MKRDWAAAELNNVKHTLSTKIVIEDDPLVRIPIKDKVAKGNCFAFSMLWCRQCLKLNRKLENRDELMSYFPLVLATQAMQSWHMRNSRNNYAGPETYYSEPYFSAMAAGFCVNASIVAKDTSFKVLDHKGWIDIVTGEEGCYVVGYHYVNGDGHGIAFWNKKPNLSFFNPNFGQYSIENYTQGDLEKIKAKPIQSWIVIKITL